MARQSRNPQHPEAELRVDPQEAIRLLKAMPPNAPGAEMALLGSMLIDPGSIGDVVGVIRSADDFFQDRHRTIYAAMVEIYDRTASVDAVRLNQLLLDRKVLEAIGGLGYIVQLAEAAPSAQFALEYARAVRDKATLRQLIDASTATVHDAFHATDDAQMILESAEQRIFAIAQRRDTATLAALPDLLREAMKALESRDGTGLTGLGTGLTDIDEMTSGLQKGEMLIVAARPSMGKTALALNLMEGVAVAGIPVAMFSLEMGRQQLVQRLLCAKAGVDGQRLRRGTLLGEDMRRLVAACDALHESKIYIDDTPGLSLLQLRSKGRRMCEKFGVGCIFIDYLQLMSSGSRSESRQVEVSDISRGIKAMARELEIPVVCLSQLNRAAEQREGHRPRMSDLRESGSIEQDADVIMMLHREEYYHHGDPEWSDMNPDKVGVAELIFAKQRNGPTGVVKLVWDQASTCFRSFSPVQPPPGVEYRAYSPSEYGSSGRSEDLGP
ncbi:MAG: replicative DNA helicase [Phycisphaerales bacterium]|nr:replicative DNA helicase [Phycisphaerales bacterium]